MAASELVAYILSWDWCSDARKVESLNHYRRIAHDWKQWDDEKTFWQAANDLVKQMMERTQAHG